MHRSATLPQLGGPVGSWSQCEGSSGHCGENIETPPTKPAATLTSRSRCHALGSIFCKERHAKICCYCRTGVLPFTCFLPCAEGGGCTLYRHEGPHKRCIPVNRGSLPDQGEPLRDALVNCSVWKLPAEAAHAQATGGTGALGQALE